MNYQEIKKNNIVVTTLTRETPVLLCRDKKTADYAFFAKLGEDNYAPVDKKTESDLRKVYNAKAPKFYNDFLDDEVVYGNLTEQQKQEYLQKAMNACRDYFFDLLLPYPEEVKERVWGNLKTLQIEVDTSERPKEEITTGGKYSPIDHISTIYAIYKNQLQSNQTLFHEMLHGATRNEDEMTCGASILIALGRRDSDFTTANVIGSGLNEAITEYIAFREISRHANPNAEETKEYERKQELSGYDFLVNVFKNICDQTDEDKLIGYYLTCDLKGMLDYLAKEYHYKDHDNILSFVYKFDSFLNLVMANSLSLIDLSSILNSLYSDLMMITCHKLRAEGKDLSNLPFEKVFSEFHIPLDGEEREKLIEKIKGYYEEFKNPAAENVDPRELEEDVFVTCSLLFMASNKKSFSLGYVPIDVIVRAFTTNTMIDADNEINSIAAKERAFRFLFSDECYAFDDCPEFKRKLIKEIIKNRFQIPFGTVKYFDIDELVLIVKEDPMMAREIMRDDLRVFLAVLEKTDDKILQSKEIQDAVILLGKSVLVQEPRAKYENLVMAYFSAFDNPPLGFSITSKIMAELGDFKKEVLERRAKQEKEDKETGKKGEGNGQDDPTA